MRLTYSSTQQTMHWLTVTLMFAILPVGWVLAAVPEETSEFFFWMDVHESLGLAIFALTVGRIIWRWFDPPPPYPVAISRSSRAIARVVHGGLLLFMIVMPISGYVWSTGHGHDVAPFHLLQFPRVVFGHRRVGDVAEQIHLIGRWIVYGLIALHLSGVSYHVTVKRDGLLARMLPPQERRRVGTRT